MTRKYEHLKEGGEERGQEREEGGKERELTHDEILPVNKNNVVEKYLKASKMFSIYH